MFVQTMMLMGGIGLVAGVAAHQGAENTLDTYQAGDETMEASSLGRSRGVQSGDLATRHDIPPIEGTSGTPGDGPQSLNPTTPVDGESKPIVRHCRDAELAAERGVQDVTRPMEYWETRDASGLCMINLENPSYCMDGHDPESSGRRIEEGDEPFEMNGTLYCNDDTSFLAGCLRGAITGGGEMLVGTVDLVKMLAAFAWEWATNRQEVINKIAEYLMSKDMYEHQDDAFRMAEQILEALKNGALEDLEVLLENTQGAAGRGEVTCRYVFEIGTIVFGATKAGKLSKLKKPGDGPDGPAEE